MTNLSTLFEIKYHISSQQESLFFLFILFFAYRNSISNYYCICCYNSNVCFNSFSLANCLLFFFSFNLLISYYCCLIFYLCNKFKILELVNSHLTLLSNKLTVQSNFFNFFLQFFFEFE